jgi:beta-N-acetylhexosaminidase
VEEYDMDAATLSVGQGVGGLILFGGAAPDDLGGEVHSLDLESLGGLPPLVMTDEEGGEIQRMANLVGPIPWPQAMAADMSQPQVQQLATQVARAMRANGVNMDLAPVLDLATGPGPDAEHVDGPRSFSPVETVAAAYGLAFARGMLDGGVIPVVKHFPGEGQASYNTDDGPANTPPIAELERNDLLPFEAAIKAGMPAIMVGNASIPGLTRRPASLSYAVVTGLLRDRLQFHGLILTDSLSVPGVSEDGYSLGQAAPLAVEAGADMVLFDATDVTDVTAQLIQAIADAVHAGQLSPARLNQAVGDVLAVKRSQFCPSQKPAGTET